MKQTDNIQSNLDKALLFLRLYTGAVIILHNIGKMQIYNEIIHTYFSLFGLSHATTFLIIGIVEVASAVLIMTGYMLRLACIAMAVVALGSSFFALMTSNMTIVGEQAALFGVYLFLAAAGGGRYGIDQIRVR